MRALTFPSFVWYSTPDSRASGVVALLAVAETVICVALYWLLWLKWGVTWHHWLILVASPLVLMRSEVSVKKGLAWFDAYWDEKEGVRLPSIKALVVIAITSTLAYGAAWFLEENWLAEFSGWALFWLYAVVGFVSVNVVLAILVAGGIVAPQAASGETVAALALAASATVAGAEAAAGAGAAVGAAAGAGAGVAAGAVVVLSKSAPPVAIAAAALGAGVGIFGGIWLRALATRTVATFLHPIAGVQAIPANWRRFVWQSDLRDPPELLPGHKETGFHRTFSDFQTDMSLSGAYVVSFSVGFVVFYFPALLWRWSIKSTAWFYLPLLWIGQGWQNIQGDDLLIWAKGYSRKWINITGVLLTTILLFFSLVALIVPRDYYDLQQTLSDAGAPLPVIGWAIVLNWQSLAEQPWQWFYLPSWVLTLMLFFLIDDHGTDIEKGAKAELRLPALRRWMWVSNARTALTNLGLLVALYYFLTAVDAWGQVMALIS